MRVLPLRIGRDDVETKWNAQSRVTVHLGNLNTSLRKIRGLDLQVCAPLYWKTAYSELNEVLHCLMIALECPLSRGICTLREQFAECTVRGEKGGYVVQWRKRRTIVPIQPRIALEGQHAVFEVLHAVARQLPPEHETWQQLVDAASQCLVPNRHVKRKSRVLVQVIWGQSRA